MVKKLISGLLKKKDAGAEKEAAPAAASDEVPDELPPLAEDVLESEGAAPAAEPAGEAAPEPEKVEAPAESADAPDELPALDIDEPKDDTAAEETPAEAPAEAPAADDAGPLDAIKKAKAAKSQTDDGTDTPAESAPAAEEAAPSSTVTDGADASRVAAQDAASDSSGFFSSILDHIKSNEGTKEKLLGGDLFGRMSNYWELRKGDIKSGTPTKSHQLLEDEMQRKLEDLKSLEQKWHVQKMALEEDVKFLHERERDIQTKVDELRRLSQELELFKNVDPKHYFHLHNGIVLRNVHDLLDALEIIDDETFAHHVSKTKNDFADWIQHIMKNKKFSEKLRKLTTKEDVISLIESEPPIVSEKHNEYKHAVPPKKYFWLENGVVIKSLYQLSDAMKTMDEELFEKHVTTRKNDFAHWVEDSLRNKELAHKLRSVRTKKEMSDILDIYL